MGRYKDDAGFAERECCICGRVFIPAVEHVFKVTGRWCCTYPCYLKLQAQIEAEQAAEREKALAERAARRARRRAQAVALPKNETFVETEGEEA